MKKISLFLMVLAASVVLTGCETLKSTITFLGVPPAVSPVFMAAVVIVVVLVQSRRVREGFTRLG